MKKHLAPWAVLAVAAALTLSSCATGTGSKGDADVTYDPNATLSGDLQVMGFGATDEIATTRLDRTEQALGDGVKVSLIEGDLDIQQFLSAVASGKPPELLYVDRNKLGSLAARGAIIPLDKCIEGEGIDTSQFVESALDQVTLDGTVYGIPEFNTVQLTMADKSLLDAAGLTIDDVNGSNWDAMAAANTALMKTDGGKLSVIGVDSKLPEFLPLWAKANGADLISADGKTAQLNSPEVVQALEYAVGIYDAQGGFSAVKAFRDSADFFGAGNQYATNQLGAMPMEQWYLNVLNDVSPEATVEFDTFRDTSGEPLAFSTGQAWAIPSGTKNPAAACRFAKTMTDVDSWVAAAQARVDARAADGKAFTGLLTANSAADAKVKELVTSSGDAKWDDGVAAMYEANDHTFSLPANPADQEFTTAWQDAVNRVLNGQADPQASLDQAQDEAQKALDKAWADLQGEG